MKNQSFRFRTPLSGLYIGGCVDGAPLKQDEVAHAHLPGSSPKWAVGYICAINRKALVGAMLHELAHLIANDGHGEPWRKEMRRLGARIPAKNRRKPRGE